MTARGPSPGVYSLDKLYLHCLERPLLYFQLRRSASSELPTLQIANPERGFFLTVYGHYSANPGWENVNLQELRAARDKQITLIRLNYVLSEFRQTKLAESFLQKFETQMNTLREAGVKGVLIFSYNFGERFNSTGQWYQDQDASLTQIQQHLDQLRPLFQKHKDVIALVHAGFTGVWGEWHHSTNDLLRNGGPDPASGINENTKVFVSKLLEALPSDRMIALRYPSHKRGLVGERALSADAAFKGSNQARIGHHNDCLLSSYNDTWTYVDIEGEKNYLNQDNKFLPMSGETCASGSEAQPYIGCQNSMAELARLRYSLLSVDPYDFAGVVKRWRQEGCFPEVNKRLGYRFRLLSSTIPQSLKSGDELPLDLTLKNDGWGILYNPRPLNIVLRDTTSGSEFSISTPLDLRLISGGEEKTVAVRAALPAAIPAGRYALYLHLPDASSSVSRRPEYAIRLANEGTWEASTGYNSLDATVEVTSRTTATPTSTSTPAPTRTPTPTAARTSTPTPIPTATSVPRTTPTVAPTATQMPRVPTSTPGAESTAKVKVYAERRFQGRVQELGIGRFEAVKSELNVVGNDAISSMTVPDGVTVKLCVHEVGGYCRTYAKGRYASLSRRIDDKVSRVEVTAVRRSQLRGR